MTKGRSEDDDETPQWITRAGPDDLERVLGVLAEPEVSAVVRDSNPGRVAADLTDPASDVEWFLAQDRAQGVVGLMRVWARSERLGGSPYMQLIESSRWSDTSAAAAFAASVAEMFVESGYLGAFVAPNDDTELVFQQAGFAPIAEFRDAEYVGYVGDRSDYELWWLGGDDRGPHYRFGHVALPAFLFSSAIGDPTNSDPVAKSLRRHYGKERLHYLDRAQLATSPNFAEMARRGALDRWLANLWDEVNADYPVTVRRDGAGLTGTLVAVDGRECVLITFPFVRTTPECYFALVAPANPPSLRRYLTYELYSGWEDRQGEVGTLCEWLDADRHRNFDQVDKTDRETFLRLAEERLHEDRPAVFARAEGPGKTVIFDLEGFAESLRFDREAETPDLRALLQLLPVGAWAVHTGYLDLGTRAYLRDCCFEFDDAQVSPPGFESDGGIPIEGLAQRLGVAPEDCLVVTGDDYTCREVRSSGMTPILLQPRLGDIGDQPTAVQRFDALQDAAPFAVRWAYEGREWPFEFERTDDDAIRDFFQQEDPYAGYDRSWDVD